MVPYLFSFYTHARKRKLFSCVLIYFSVTKLKSPKFPNSTLTVYNSIKIIADEKFTSRVIQTTSARRKRCSSSSFSYCWAAQIGSSLLSLLSPRCQPSMVRSVCDTAVIVFWANRGIGGRVHQYIPVGWTTGALWSLVRDWDIIAVCTQSCQPYFTAERVDTVEWLQLILHQPGRPGLELLNTHPARCCWVYEATVSRIWTPGVWRISYYTTVKWRLLFRALLLQTFSSQ